MKLDFLPPEIREGLARLDILGLEEIRLRARQAVIICYRGEYKYLCRDGAGSSADGAIKCQGPQKVLYDAMEGSVFAFTEQLKNAFITVDDGVRIGVAGEYVFHGGEIISVKNVTSLNIRIPHDIEGCSDGLFSLLGKEPRDILLFSEPGYGKTTMLRDIARHYSKTGINVLVCDERGEIALSYAGGEGYDLGPCADVVRGADKQRAFANAIKAMKPRILITDELFGEVDFDAAEMARKCGVNIVASTHCCDKIKLSQYAYDYYVRLTGVTGTAIVYDKDFNPVGDCSTVGHARDVAFGRQKETGKDVSGVL